MKSNYEIIKKVSIVTLLFNFLLCILKIVVGMLGKSSALVIDGYHSFSDALTTIFVLIGAKIGDKEADESHPYGHERFETLILLGLSVIIISCGVCVCADSVRHLVLFFMGKFIPSVPSKLAFYIAIVSILVKEFMYQYTIRNANKINSSLLKSDAIHHRSDALSSIGSAIGIFGMFYDLLWADAVAGVFISILIIWSGVELIKVAGDELVDHSASKEEIAEIMQAVNSVAGIESLDNVKTRMFADKIYVDIEISVDGDISVKDGHAIAENVHDKVEEVNSKIKHCHVHVNPYLKGDKEGC